MDHKTKRRLGKFWRWLRPMVVTVIVLAAFRSSVADWNDVPTGSMEPSILPGDRIFVNKLACCLRLPFTRHSLAEWSSPERGEIVVFFGPDSDKRMVKRVVALPADVLEVRDGRLVINGQPATYEISDDGRATETIGEFTHPVTFGLLPRAPRSFGPIVVPAGQYFLMGDNRDNSRDSRYFGPVDHRRIVGRSSTVVFSLDHDDYWLPRGDRFFRKLP